MSGTIVCGFAPTPEAAKALAPLCRQLSIDLYAENQAIPKAALVLSVIDGALTLGRHPALKEKPIAIDFDDAAARARRGKQLLVKAIGGGSQRPAVLDATAGLGRDSAVLMAFDYSITMAEQHPVVGALLEDGLRRTQQQAELRIEKASAVMSQQRWPVIYLDPMFEASSKSALVKKDLRLLHDLLADSPTQADLLDLALASAIHRVVVKRALKASPLPCASGRKPDLSVAGKAVRYDVYALKAYV